MTNEDLIKIGFTELPHKTICGTVVYDLGRHRNLSVQNAGNPNEMVFICEMESENVITDLICVHNYDYDGYLSEKKIIALINAIIGLNF